VSVRTGWIVSGALIATGIALIVIAFLLVL
jgi:hypothetical protein